MKRRDLWRLKKNLNNKGFRVVTKARGNGKKWRGVRGRLVEVDPYRNGKRAWGVDKQHNIFHCNTKRCYK
jgi:hypothetical protein